MTYHFREHRVDHLLGSKQLTPYKTGGIMDEMTTLTASGVGTRLTSVTQQLTAERKILMKRITELDIALTALKNNPEVQKVFDAVSKVNRSRY